MSLLRWGCVPLVGLGLVAWGYFGAPAREATEIFATAALFILAGGAVFVAGLIVLVGVTPASRTGAARRPTAAATTGLQPAVLEVAQQHPDG